VLYPIEVRLDLEVNAGYVRYRRLPDDQRIARSSRLTEDAVVDYDESGGILGVELLAFDNATPRPVQEFASHNGLEFPAEALRVLRMLRTPRSGRA
jgi:uncharacterized protein YuzE